MNKTEKTFSLISVKDSFFKARYEVLDESTGDNRHNTCLVEQCNTSKEAENFLYDDTGGFAA